jgi:hypothetical protein
MRHLRLHSADEVRARAGLHTLSLLVSNQPNRSIIAELAGQAALAGVLRACPALDVREQCVQLMWDLDGAGGAGAAPALAPPDLAALLGVLRDTGSAAVASHALHFLRAALELPPGGGRPALAPDEAGAAAAALVREACAHVHHLQDAAQYSLGAALGAVLVDPGVGDGGVRQALAALLAALRARPDGAQCQGESRAARGSAGARVAPWCIACSRRERVCPFGLGFHAACSRCTPPPPPPHARSAAHGSQLPGGQAAAAGGAGGGRRAPHAAAVQPARARLAAAGARAVAGQGPQQGGDSGGGGGHLVLWARRRAARLGAPQGAPPAAPRQIDT